MACEYCRPPFKILPNGGRITYNEHLKGYYQCSRYRADKQLSWKEILKCPECDRRFYEIIAPDGRKLGE